ncbi:MAG: hypothetical protein ACFFA4_16300 [Promethearchaeota archaeon]
MNRSKILPKSILLAILGILILSFIPAVAASGGNVTERSIDDWLDPNYAFYPWGEENWVMADFGSPYTNLVCKLGFPWPKAGFGPWVNDMEDQNGMVAGDTIIDGNITERELNDGTALITLHLDVKNGPLTVYDYDDFILYCLGLASEPQAVLGSGIDGYMDYKIIYKFIIPEPGAELPTVWSSFDNYISVNIHGIGYGTLTERAVELGFAETAGTIGMVLLHQIALFKPDLNEEHPNYDPYYGELWPVETVEIYEMS